MNNIFRFREFPVYKDARKFREELKQLSREKFPKKEQFCLTSQLWRALDSILLNIAEGADKHSDKDFSRFLNISLGSINEVIGCFDCAFDDGYVNKSEHQECLIKAENIVRQLKAFLAKIRRDDKKF